MTTEARESGIRRLAKALAERERAAGRYAGLRGAEDRASAARQAWLRLVDKDLTGDRPGSTSAR